MKRDSIHKSSENGLISVVQISEIKKIDTFETFDKFKSYCAGRTVFPQNELLKFWTNKRNEYVFELLFIKKLARNIGYSDFKSKIPNISVKSFTEIDAKTYNIVIKSSNTQIIYAKTTK